MLNRAFYGKTMGNVGNRLKMELNKKTENDKTIKQQSKLTFDGVHKLYTNFDSYTFQQNEVITDQPVYLVFAILEISNLLMYETYFEKLQPYFREKDIQLH